GEESGLGRRGKWKNTVEAAKQPPHLRKGWGEGDAPPPPIDLFEVIQPLDRNFQSCFSQTIGEDGKDNKGEGVRGKTLDPSHRETVHGCHITGRLFDDDLLAEKEPDGDRFRNHGVLPSRPGRYYCTLVRSSVVPSEGTGEGVATVCLAAGSVCPGVSCPLPFLSASPFWLGACFFRVTASPRRVRP